MPVGIFECPKCGARNYLENLRFWNFEGNLKCAGYDTIYYLKIANYEIVEYRESSGEFVLPSVAETKDFKWIWEPGKKTAYFTVLGEEPEKHTFAPIHTDKNLRGNWVSAKPVKGYAGIAGSYHWKPYWAEEKKE